MATGGLLQGFDRVPVSRGPSDELPSGGWPRTEIGSVAFADQGSRGWVGEPIKSPASGCCHGRRSPGCRIPVEVVMVTVRWNARYGLSYRDVEELMAERGVEVDHVAAYRWVCAAD